jgi:GNAT superfamily N-acetyltransferase
MADGRQALVVNVFIKPQSRRRGLARLLMERIIAWSREQRIESLVLHASDQGAPFTNNSASFKRTECGCKAGAGRAAAA